jgi:hypothetical protein
MSVKLGTHVSNTHAHVFKAPHVRVIMRLQDVQTGSVINTCKACGHTSTVCLQCDASNMDHSSFQLLSRLRHYKFVTTSCCVDLLHRGALRIR